MQALRKAHVPRHPGSFVLNALGLLTHCGIYDPIRWTRPSTRPSIACSTSSAAIPKPVVGRPRGQLTPVDEISLSQTLYAHYMGNSALLFTISDSLNHDVLMLYHGSSLTRCTMGRSSLTYTIVAPWVGGQRYVSNALLRGRIQ